MCLAVRAVEASAGIKIYVGVVEAGHVVQLYLVATES